MNKYTVYTTCIILILLSGWIHITAARTRAVNLPNATINTTLRDGALEAWGTSTNNLHALAGDAVTTTSQIAVGDHHAIALRSDGTLRGWGINTTGELTIPSDATNIVQVDVGITMSVALKRTGSVVMWGLASSITPPTGSTPPSDVTRIAAGDNHIILLRSNGTVMVYGASTQQTLPAQLSGKVIVAIAAGSTTSLALDNTGTLYRWGSNGTLPSLVTSDVVGIFAHGDTIGALKNDGTLVLWGNVANLTNLPDDTIVTGNSTSGCPCVSIPNMAELRQFEVAAWGVAITRKNGAALVLPYANSTAPSDIPTDILQLGTHYRHAAGIAVHTPQIIATATIPTPRNLTLRLPVALRGIGQLSVWGGSSAIRTIPISVTNNLSQVVAGSGFIAVLRNDSTVIAWGENESGQTTVPSSLSIARTNTDPLRIVGLAAGARHALAVRANGSVVAWGDNTFGQRTVPANLTTAIQVATGDRHSLALLQNGTVVCWGDTTFGQCPPPTLLGVAQIRAEGWHSVALLYNKTAVAWGRNNMGQILLPKTQNTVDIATSNSATALLQANGSVIVVGDSTAQQSDLSDISFQQLGAGAYHFLGITTQGTVQGWGLNSSNQLDVPAGLQNVFAVAGGSNFSVALRYNQLTPTTTPLSTTTIPTVNLPTIPTALPQPTYSAMTVWGSLGTIPPVTDTDIVAAAITSDTIGIVHQDGSVTLNQASGSLFPTPPSNAQSNVQSIQLGDFGAVVSRDRKLIVWGNAPSVPVAFQQHIREISLMANHLVIVTIDNRIWSNLFPISATKPIRHIAAGATFAGILYDDGSVAVVSTDNREGVNLVPADAITLSELAAGTNHLVGLRSDGRVIAWGAQRSDVGQTGVPFAAQSGIVAIAAANQYSIALATDGTLVAWGVLPAGTRTQLTALNTTKNTSALVAGNTILAALQAGVIAPTPAATNTRYPTLTPVAVPSLTARPRTNDIIGNQIGYFTMDNLAPLTQFGSTAGAFTCTAASACPQSERDRGNQRVARFTASRGDELTSANKFTLGNSSFTISYWLRRERNDRHDAVLSTGTMGAANSFLTMGIDNENSIYCSFFGNDLRSAPWYSDTNWHHYACTFNKTTLVRQLYRDGLLIAQDIASAPLKSPAAAITIGRRNDNATGLQGSVDDVIVHSRVLTPSELQTQPLPSDSRLVTVPFDDISVMGISPNQSQLTCVTVASCATFDIGSHDLGVLVFNGNQQMQLSEPALLNKGFTIAYWAQRNNNGAQTIITKGKTNQLVMGFDNSNKPFCKVGTTIITASTAITDNAWHFYLCSYDTTKTTLLFAVDRLTPQTSSATYTDSGTLLIGRSSNNTLGFNGVIDDIFIYTIPASNAMRETIYNISNPPSIIPTTVNAMTATIATPFSATRTATRTATIMQTKTPLPSTATQVIAYVPSSTNTATSSRTLSPTRSLTSTRTLSHTKTSTAIAPPAQSHTPSITATATMTRTATASATATRTGATPTLTVMKSTRTPLIITRTYLSRMSPTYYALTLTATSRSLIATQTSFALTATAAGTATMAAQQTATAARIATLTAYPIPATGTVTPTAYPVPTIRKNP
jgi:alpha-tubulin suppressor-like RCC1 family protein